MAMPPNFAPTSLDHVALWVDERAPLAELLCGYLGMHVVEATEDFTLVGIDAKLGKLTLFEADGPRQRGAVQRVVLRVNDLDSVLASLPFKVPRRDDGVAAFEAVAAAPRPDAAHHLDENYLARGPGDVQTGRALRPARGEAVAAGGQSPACEGLRHRIDG